MYGSLKFSSLMSSACPSFGFWEVISIQISTVLKLVGRLAQTCMEITTQDFSPTGQVMPIKPLVATIYFAQALFRSTTKLPWEPAFPLFPATKVLNMISAFLSGRIQKRATGGCNLGMIMC
nr:hypothetical protein Iba_chr12bCG3340 [Ipomoea batatas]GMD71685.1 hypothetical protein Iba_chr12fCG1270 [Ipomoea batatas]